MGKSIVHRHMSANGIKPLPNIKNILAIASGKGGVGKSTVALNIALALQKLGAAVGLLDADIYGPSQPLMLGIPSQKPEIGSDKTITPIIAHGLQTMSIGYLIDSKAPAVWRGPMVSGALQQMLNGTAWRDLDYLIIDLPPGTGDIQLTLAQKVPVCGAVVVTTPQDVALIDVEKAIQMFNKVKIPILGVVENMSTHVCSNCGHEEAIFGSQGGLNLATQNSVELLGKLPLDRQICELSDKGKPCVISMPDSLATKEFISIATKVVQQLSKLPRDYSLPATSIVIE